MKFEIFEALTSFNLFEHRAPFGKQHYVFGVKFMFYNNEFYFYNCLEGTFLQVLSFSEVTAKDFVLIPRQ